MPLASMSNDATPHQLYVQARRGDRGALQELAREWWPQIKRWALIELGDHALADDACQETLVRLVQHIEALDETRPLGGWLRTVLRNCCRDAARRERRHQKKVVSVREAGGDLERAVDLRRGAKRMLAAFATLTPRQREALDWVDRQGLSPTEAALEMNAAPGTVRVLLHQGRRALRASLIDDLGELVRTT